MKKSFLFFLIFALFAGCSKKEEEIKIVKPDEVKTEQKTEDNKQVKDSVTELSGTEKTQERKYTETQSVKKILSAEAGSNIDRRVLLTGYVADVAVREKVAYLNLDKKYPNNTCSVTIFESDFDKFGDFNKYKNKKIEVSGKVTEYKGKPQVIIKSPSQIKILN